MPSAPSSTLTLLIGWMITACSLTALGADGTPSPPATDREGAVQRGLHSLYDMPKDSSGRPTAPAPDSARGSHSPTAQKPYSPPQNTPRYSRNLAATDRPRTPTTARLGAGTPAEQNPISPELRDPAPPFYNDRRYIGPSIGGYRGFGKYGYGRRSYYDYRRARRWPVYSREWNDPQYGPGREDVYSYGDSFTPGNFGYAPGFGYGPGYDYGYPRGGFVPADEAYRAGTARRGPDYNYFDYMGNARTESLLHGALTSRDRGLAHFRQGQYREAADAFRLACETNNGDPAAQIYAGHALFATGRYRDAAKYLRKAFELQPRIVYLTYDMREDYRDRAEFDRQLAALQDALRLSPRDPDRLFVLGYVLYYGGQRDKAYGAFEKLAYLNPRDSLVIRLKEACQPPDVAIMPSGPQSR